MKVILVLFLLSLQLSLIHAEEPVRINEPVHIEDGRTEQGRPRMPKKDTNIRCIYNDGILTVSFEQSEGFAKFFVSDEIFSMSPFIVLDFDTSVTFRYNIGIYRSIIAIKILTDTHEYVGYIYPD